MKSRIRVVVACLLLLLPLYCLSIGPVVKLHHFGLLPAGVGRLYDPLVGPMNRFRAFAGFMVWYQELWGIGPPAPSASSTIKLIPPSNRAPSRGSEK